MFSHTPRARMAGVVVVCVLIMTTLLPASPPAMVQAQTEERCFDETGFCISGRIREFWEQNDGLRVFGLPITAQRFETIEGQRLEVQWFQRNRLELHPNNERPFDVLLGRLGADRLVQASRNPNAFPDSPPDEPRCRFFPETGHNVCGRMLQAWRANGLEIDGQTGLSEGENLALFGLPLSNEITETLSDGQQHTVQWFERARFEIHYFPDERNRLNSLVLFGLLGNEIRTGPDLDDVPPPPAAGAPVQRIAYEANLGINPSLFPDADVATVRYIFTMNTFGSEQESLTRNHVQPDKHPDWSPDGSQIVFDSLRDGARADVYVMNRDGSNIRRLTNNNSDDGFPVWSPNGQQIAYASNETGDYEIYVMNADGSNKRRITTNPGKQDLHPSWSPDGRQLVYASNSGLTRGEWEIYVVAASGGTPVNISRSSSNDEDPVWGSNNRIAFQSDRDGNREIYVMDADGSNVENLSNHPAQDEAPAWSPDGRQLAFQTNRIGAPEIFVMNANGRQQRNISNSPASDENPAWSRDLRVDTVDPCPFIPPPVYSTVEPARCVPTGEVLSVDVYGFLANAPYVYRVLGVTTDGNLIDQIAGEGTVDRYGQLNDVPITGLVPGRYRLEFTFVSDAGSFDGATVYLDIR